MIFRIYKHILISAVFVCGIMFAATSVCAASTLSLSEFALETHGDILTIHTSLALTEQQEALESLYNGAQLELNAGIFVDHSKSWYAPNIHIVEIKRSFMIRYDPLIRTFILSQNQEQTQFKTLDSLLHAAWDSIPLQIKLDTALKHGETYKVTVNVDLQQADISPWLKKILFFKSWEVSPSLSITQQVDF